MQLYLRGLRLMGKQEGKEKGPWRVGKETGRCRNGEIPIFARIDVFVYFYASLMRTSMMTNVIVHQ